MNFLTKKVSIPIAAIALGGIIYAGIGAQAYTPPDTDDSLTFMVDLRGFRRLTATAWTCGGGCRAARTGGAAPRGCMLYAANITGIASIQTAANSCAGTLATACTGAAVDDCTSGERF